MNIIFDPFERHIRRTLRKLAKQRVRMILPPNAWVIERAVEDDNEETRAALHTCYMRGWIEPLQEGVPMSSIPTDGRLPTGFSFDRRSNLYRLTSAGWSVIHRSSLIALCALLISSGSFVIAMIALAMRLK